MLSYKQRDSGIKPVNFRHEAENGLCDSML